MAADDLYAMLEKFINKYAYLDVTYYIMVIVKNQYQGPSALNEGKVETKEVKVPDRMIHNRLVGPIIRKPLIRQLGTMLWKVNNQQGECTLEYALPMDVPTLQEDSDGEVVEKVARSAQGIPLIWN